MNIKRTIAALFLVAGISMATPIGTLGVGSSGYVQATLTSIYWTPDASALPTPGPPWNGDVNSATNLTFAGGPLVLREGVEINNAQPFGAAPPAGAGIYNPFLQFELHPNLLYTLTGVNPGSPNTNCAGLAIGQSCSISVNGQTSPVVLTMLGTTSSLVSISMFGTATDGTGPLSTWTGGFSATIPNMTPLEILQYFCGSDNTCSASEAAAGTVLDVRSVSGSFQATAVPEPSSISLLLIGAAAIAFGAARKRKSA